MRERMSEEFETWLLEILDWYIEDRGGKVWAEDCISLLESHCQRKDEIFGGKGKSDWRESRKLRNKVLEVTKGGRFSGKFSEQEAFHKVALWCEEQVDDEMKASALQYYLAEINSCICSGQIKKAMQMKKEISWLALYPRRLWEFRKDERPDNEEE